MGDLRSAEERRRAKLKQRKMQRFEKLKKMEKLRKLLKATPCSAGEQACHHIESLPPQPASERHSAPHAPAVHEQPTIHKPVQQQSHAPEQRVAETSQKDIQTVTEKPDTTATELLDVRRNHHALQLGKNPEERREPVDIAERYGTSRNFFKNIFEQVK